MLYHVRMGKLLQGFVQITDVALLTTMLLQVFILRNPVLRDPARMTTRILACEKSFVREGISSDFVQTDFIRSFRDASKDLFVVTSR